MFRYMIVLPTCLNYVIYLTKLNMQVRSFHKKSFTGGMAGEDTNEIAHSGHLYIVVICAKQVI